MGTPRPRKKDHVEMGRRLKALERAIGINSTAIAARIGIDPPKLSNYYSGANGMKPDIANRFRLAFGVTSDWIYFGDERGLPHELVIRLRDAAKAENDGESEDRKAS